MDSKEAENCRIPTATVTIASGTAGSAGEHYSIGDDYQIDLASVNTLLNNTINLGAIGGTGTVIGGNTSGVYNNPIYTTTTTGTGGYNWNINSNPTTISAGGQMDLQGEKADIRINGKSLKDWMTKVEERLNILTPNPQLEKEWDELRRLGERYRKLEKKCNEKAEMWKQLKKMPAPKPDQF